jgi:hypothetical protein
MTTPSPDRLLHKGRASRMERRAFLRLAVASAGILATPALLRRAFAEPASAGCSDGDPASYADLSGEHRAGTFLLFSDVHFDPFADPARVRALAAAPASQWRGIFAEASPGFSRYGQDCNDALFQSFLDDMAARVPRPDFVLFPGDLLCHGFWTRYPKLTGDTSKQGLLNFIEKTADYFLREVTRRFPDIPVYPALGNNDSFEGDFQIAPDSPYLAVTAPLIARLALKNETARAGFLETYPGYGCYSVPLPGNGRLIVYNNIFWAKRSAHPQAGRPVMEFVEREVRAAAGRGEKVWLMAHVPPGDNSKSTAAKFLKTGTRGSNPLLAEAWRTAMPRLLVAHAGAIRASFAGHVHRDEFRIIYSGNETPPVGAMRLAPSISPITGNNPGYQVYVYDKKSFELLDVTVHSLGLEAAGPAWAQEYVYSRMYGRGLRTAKDWQDMYLELKTCPARGAAFGEAFDVRSGHIREVTAKTFPIFWDGLAVKG